MERYNDWVCECRDVVRGEAVRWMRWWDVKDWISVECMRWGEEGSSRTLGS